jgi:hypothetical protein
MCGLAAILLFGDVESRAVSAETYQNFSINLPSGKYRISSCQIFHQRCITQFFHQKSEGTVPGDFQTIAYESLKQINIFVSKSEQNVEFYLIIPMKLYDRKLTCRNYEIFENLY